jgi:TorA maturation chaperone TorD
MGREPVTAAVEDANALAEEDALRAQFYRLIALVFARPADDGTLALLAGLGGDDTDLGAVLGRLAAAANAATPAQVEDDYNRLFIGMTRGEIVPYASYYITGFLNDKPLAVLRQDMARLGIARADGVSEPEDHIASLCEMMAGLIEGGFGAPADQAEQRDFFNRHLAPWASRLFIDIEDAANGSLYGPAANVGRHFMAIEAEAFTMAEG